MEETRVRKSSPCPGCCQSQPTRLPRSSLSSEGKEVLSGDTAVLDRLSPPRCPPHATTRQALPTRKRKRQRAATTRVWSSSLAVLMMTLATTIAPMSATTFSCDPTSVSFGDAFCGRKLRPGSLCDPILKRCTNPFAQGCLSSILGKGEGKQYSNLRACNSNDDGFVDKDGYGVAIVMDDVSSSIDPDSAEREQQQQQRQQICIPSPFNYTEIRIHAGTWDSSLALAWIYQIVLSERLQVPVTIVGKEGKSSSHPENFHDDQHQESSISFYHTDHTFGYADQPYDWDALEMTNLVDGGDCRHADPYHLSCAHVMPQVWAAAFPRWDQAVRENTIVASTSSSAASNADLITYEDGDEDDDTSEESVSTISKGNSNSNDNYGMMGKTSLYIPERTAKRYPALVTHYGLQSASPQQLAHIFRQPFTWGYYCQNISPTECSESDAVAYRLPMTTEETFSFYEDGLFTGYFGISTDADADADDTATATANGQIIVPSSCDEFTRNTVEAQLYWNNISLSSHGPLLPNQGYDLKHIRQIYHAANATQSDVIIWWWSPDSLVEMYRGTDYAMQPVGLPQYTRECGEYQQQTMISSSTDGALCSPDITERLGPEEGACDLPEHRLRQAISLSISRQQHVTDISAQSPAYETLRNIRVTNLEMNDILKMWGASRISNMTSEREFGYKAREAVCTWVAQHIETLDAAIPFGYPRTVKNSEDFDQPYLFGAQAVAAIASLLVLYAGVASVYWRRRLAVVYAQAHFVFLILLGLWFLAMAAIVTAKEPSDSRCLLGQWLIELGLAFALVPLVVKVVTMNYIAITMHKTTDRHITISPGKMFLCELALATCAIMYMMVWSAKDPPSPVETQQLTIEAGSNILETTISCSSSSDSWMIASFICQALLLVSATVLSVLLRRVVEEFKESNALERMIYFQDLFLVARVVLFWSRASMEPAVYSAILSFLFSFGAAAPLAIYFVPMFARVSHGEIDEEMVLFYPAGDLTVDAQSRLASEPRPARDSYQSTVGMESTGGTAINALIQAHMTVTRQRQGTEGTITLSGASAQDEPITAECSRSLGRGDITS